MKSKALYFPIKALAPALLLAATVAPSQARELVFSIIGTPKHVINGVIIPEWAANVKKATQGRVTIKVLPTSVAPPPRMYDAVRTGIVDSAYTLNAFLVEKAPLIQIGQLPLMFTSGPGVATALWRTYNTYFKAKHPLPGVVVLGFVSGSGGVICGLKGQIDSVAALRNMKMWSMPGFSAEAMGRLKASVVPGPGARIYSIVSKGIVDGYSGLSISDAYSFKAAQYAKSCTVVPGGVFTPNFTVMVQPKAWASLTEADRNAVMSVSGEMLARESRHWDAVEAKAVARFKADGKDLHTASPALDADLRRAWMPIHEAWIKRANALGIDGKAAYDYFRAQAKAVAAKSE